MSDSIGWFVPLDEITPHPENPRVNAHAVAEVAASIKRFGFSSPIVCRKADGVIIAGHTRYLAAQAIGLDKVPVRFLELDPVNARLLMLADNRLGEKAWWDEGRLSAILNDLRDEDLTGLGWDDAEIEHITGQYADLDQAIDQGWEDIDLDSKAGRTLCPHCGEEI